MSEHECTEHLLDEIERLREANFELREGELRQRIKQLEAVVNDPEALWTNWLRGTVKLPSGIGDVRQYQAHIQRLEECGHQLFLWLDRNTPVTVRNDWIKAKEAKL